jgi:hypothetical protein
VRGDGDGVISFLYAASGLWNNWASILVGLAVTVVLAPLPEGKGFAAVRSTQKARSMCMLTWSFVETGPR